MRKRGDLEITTMFWLLGIILASFILASLLVFIESSANGVNFKKNFMARDMAVIVNTLYLSPGDSYVYYPINDKVYSFAIGKFQEGYRVKVGAAKSILLNDYWYMEDSYEKQINTQVGNIYDINGLMLIKNNEGITVSDTAPDFDEAIVKKGTLKEAANNIPIISSFIKDEFYSRDELIDDAKKKTSSLNVVWPVEIKDKIVTSCYGDRGDVIVKRCGKQHCGVDIRVKDKDDGKVADVVAMASGKVVNVGKSMGEVVIEHANNVRGIYVHMDVIYVSSGQMVKAGQRIGKGGNKGNEAREGEEHLHLGILVDGVYFDPFEIGLFDDKFSCVKTSNCFINLYSYDIKKICEEV